MAPEVQMRNINGEIYSNDVIIHEWEFCPAIIRDYELDVNCILCVLKDGVPVGPSVPITLRVIGKCEMGFLEVSYFISISHVYFLNKWINGFVCARYIYIYIF